MTMRHWIACLLLAAVAFACCFYLGVDAGHTAAITLAAFMAGVANILLEALSADPAVLEPEAIRAPRGLEEEQAVAFSLSVNGGRSGNRARVQLVRLAHRALQPDSHGEPHDVVPHRAGPALAAVLDDDARAKDLSQGTMAAAVEELEVHLRAENPPQRTKEPDTR